MCFLTNTASIDLCLGQSKDKTTYSQYSSIRITHPWQPFLLPTSQHCIDNLRLTHKSYNNQKIYTIKISQNIVKPRFVDKQQIAGSLLSEQQTSPRRRIKPKFTTQAYLLAHDSDHIRASRADWESDPTKRDPTHLI